MDGSEKRYGTSYRLQIRGLKLVFQELYPRFKGLRQLAKGQDYRIENLCGVHHANSERLIVMSIRSNTHKLDLLLLCLIRDLGLDVRLKAILGYLKAAVRGG